MEKPLALTGGLVDGDVGFEGIFVSPEEHALRQHERVESARETGETPVSGAPRLATEHGLQRHTPRRWRTKTMRCAAPPRVVRVRARDDTPQLPPPQQQEPEPRGGRGFMALPKQGVSGALGLARGGVGLAFAVARGVMRTPDQLSKAAGVPNNPLSLTFNGASGVWLAHLCSRNPSPPLFSRGCRVGGKR